uniref:Uncharacterized protein n=1 Tax=Opuntia streptacantha TaxID=393608 RepID=A0A7C9DM47_OPUST
MLQRLNSFAILVVSEQAFTTLSSYLTDPSFDSFCFSALRTSSSASFDSLLVLLPLVSPMSRATISPPSMLGSAMNRTTTSVIPGCSDIRCPKAKASRSSGPPKKKTWITEETLLAATWDEPPSPRSTRRATEQGAF